MTPLWLNIVALAMYPRWNVAVIRALGPSGLALSLVLARCAGAACPFWAAHRRVGTLGMELKRYCLKLALAVGGLVAASTSVRWLGETLAPRSWVGQFLCVALASFMGLLAYGGIELTAGIRELDEAVALMKGCAAGGNGTEASPSECPRWARRIVNIGMKG